MKSKILAAVMTALLVASPLALAATLGQYPTYLFKAHALDAYVVVGSAASPADVVGAVDLATRLAGESYEEVSATASDATSGATSEEIPLGETIAGGSKLDSTLKQFKLSGLKDSSISFQDDTYDFHDEIILASNSGSGNTLDVETSLSASDDDYGSNVYLEATKDSLKYALVFDESINMSTATTDEPLEIDFLGKTLVVESVTDADTFTVRVGDQYTLNIDESVKVLGKTVTLKNVFSTGSVLIDVDGVSATVARNTQKTVNGIKVKPTDYGYSDTKEERVAVMLIGEETTKSYSDGDPYIGEDKNSPNWIWNLAGLTSTSPTLQIENDFVKDDFADTPVTVAGCYQFPTAYAKVCVDSLTVSTYQAYEMKIDTGVDLSDAGATYGTSNTVLTITSPGADEGLAVTVGGTNKTDTVYLKSHTDGNVAVFYVDTNNDVKWAGNLSLDTAYQEVAQINYQDTKGGDVTIDIRNVSAITGNYAMYVNVTNTVTANDNIRSTWVTASGVFDHLGTNADDSDSDELAWGLTPTSIGTKTKDLRTLYGIIVKNPDTNGAADKVSLSMPADQVKAKVVVYGPGGSSTTTSGNTIKKVVPVTTPVAKLDTEITDAATTGKNLVLVGGPAVNRLTAQAMGLSYPTFGGSGSLPFAEGEGYIAVKDGVFQTGKVVVIVAGWEAAQTRMATTLLQQYTSYASELGSNTAVKVTSLSASGITPITATTTTVAAV